MIRTFGSHWILSVYSTVLWNGHPLLELVDRSQNTLQMHRTPLQSYRHQNPRHVPARDRWNQRIKDCLRRFYPSASCGIGKPSHTCHSFLCPRRTLKSSWYRTKLGSYARPRPSTRLKWQASSTWTSGLWNQGQECNCGQREASLTLAKFVLRDWSQVLDWTSRLLFVLNYDQGYQMGQPRRNQAKILSYLKWESQASLHLLSPLLWQLQAIYNYRRFQYVNFTRKNQALSTFSPC